ncbi:hypothetical protein BAE44_0026319 [Dichanthelium oligosanthes]|uniref:RING-type domain-containing protein n=1 Tax=Dichanthelium oligosanthes TaxID=888268 RepID=A0A1E5UIE9_9POAL|nr:hypothetical protein BAE44_0026319 [Dichanthelium oligosanthes]
MEECITPQGGGKEPPVAAPPPVPPPGGDVFDPTRFDGAILALTALGGSLEEDLVLLGQEDGEDLADAYDDEDVEVYDMDDDADGGESDSELEEKDEPLRFWDGDAAGSNNDLAARPVMFLGQPARFVSYQNTAGFMRLPAAEAPPGQDAGVIVVHYRYHRFSVPRRSGGHDGVEVPDFGTCLHHVRYLVPFPAVVADPASSLRLVGASLAADVYPYRYHAQLQALWSGMLAAAPVRVPPRATRLVVTVDVGVLRSENCTPERLECMRSALAEQAHEADASPMACGLEQHLPAPVCRDESSGEVHRATKRRRLAIAGELCAICHEVLEQDLAAWPRCSHVFHGKCLEQLLATVRHRCPVCRSTLSIEGMFD